VGCIKACLPNREASAGPWSMSGIGSGEPVRQMCRCTGINQLQNETIFSASFIPGIFIKSY
jgi:hypothetical protein